MTYGRSFGGRLTSGFAILLTRRNSLTQAIANCQKALTYLPNDLGVNYRLGVLYSEKFNQQNQLGLLAAAKLHFSRVDSIESRCDRS